MVHQWLARAGTLFGLPAELAFTPTWRLLTPPLRFSLTMWLGLALLGLVGLDFAGAVWYCRAPFLVDWPRVAVSAGLALGFLGCARKAGAILIAASPQSESIASELVEGRCPICREEVIALGEAPFDFEVCPSCERAWTRRGYEVDWP